MTTGWGLVVFGCLYILNTVAGIALTAWRDRWLQGKQLASEEFQTGMTARGEVDVNLRRQGKRR